MDKETIRAREFPVTRNLVYLNHAAVGPLPERTHAAMERFAADQRDWGALHWRDWLARYQELRELAASLIGATPAEISIVKNTTEGLAFVAEGFRWHEGDSVVTTDMEFPSNFAPWKRLERLGVECRLIGTRDGRFETRDIEPLLDARTRILSLSSVSFHNGFAPDLDAIGELCAARGVLFCLDAIQSIGVLRMDVRKSKVAFLAADGHKWMLGPEGAGIFYCAEEARELLEVREAGWLSLERRGRFVGAPVEFQPDGRRFEGGSLNTIGVCGLGASLSLLGEVGIDAIEQEVLRLCRRLSEGLERIGFRPGLAGPVRSGIVSAIPPGPARGPDLLRLHAALERERIVCAPREGMLRFSPHFYNDDAEIDRVIEVLSRA